MLRPPASTRERCPYPGPRAAGAAAGRLDVPPPGPAQRVRDAPAGHTRQHPRFPSPPRAHAETGWYLHASACVLVEAGRYRPGTAEQLAALPGITVLDLDLPAALAVAQQATWAPAHARHAAQPRVYRTRSGSRCRRHGPHPVLGTVGDPLRRPAGGEPVPCEDPSPRRTGRRHPQVLAASSQTAVLDHPGHQPRPGRPRPASGQLRVKMEKAQSRCAVAVAVIGPATQRLSPTVELSLSSTGRTSSV